MKLAGMTQKIAPVLITILILIFVGLVSVGLYHLVLWSISWPWVDIGIATAFVLGLTVVLSLCAFIIYFIKENWDKCALPIKWLCKPFLLVFKPLKPVGKVTASGLIKFADGLEGFGMFIKEYISATKSNHCPSIEWEE